MVCIFSIFSPHLNTLSNSLSFKLCQWRFRTLTIYLFTTKWNSYSSGNTVLNITYTEIWDFTVHIIVIQDPAPELSPTKHFRHYFQFRNLGDMSQRNIDKKTNNNDMQIFNMKHKIQIIYFKKISSTWFLRNPYYYYYYYYFIGLVNEWCYVFIYLFSNSVFSRTADAFLKKKTQIFFLHKLHESFVQKCNENFQLITYATTYLLPEIILGTENFPGVLQGKIISNWR